MHQKTQFILPILVQQDITKTIYVLFFFPLKSWFCFSFFFFFTHNMASKRLSTDLNLTRTTAELNFSHEVSQQVFVHSRFLYKYKFVLFNRSTWHIHFTIWECGAFSLKREHYAHVNDSYIFINRSTITQSYKLTN